MENTLKKRIILVIVLLITVGVLFIISKNRTEEITRETEGTSSYTSQSVYETAANHSISSQQASSNPNMSTTNPPLTEVTTEFRRETLENYSNEILSAVNKAREEEGLDVLSSNENLKHVANIRAEEFKNTEGYERPDGSNFQTALEENLYLFRQAVENHAIADVRYTAQDVVLTWLQDANNKSNILLPDFTSMAISAVEENGQYYIVLLLVEDYSEPYLSSYSDSQIVALLYEYVNEFRQHYGYSNLNRSLAIEDAASIRAMELPFRFSHWRPDGVSWHTVLADLNIRSANHAEVIDHVSNMDQSARNLVLSWIHSAQGSHILNGNFQNLGISVNRRDGGLYIVLVFTN